MITDSAPYELRQEAHNRDYLKAWEDASPQFRAQAEKLGLAPSIEKENTVVLEYDTNRAESSYEVDMPSIIDTYIDYLVEKYGSSHEMVLRKMAADLQEPMRLAVEHQRDDLLCRIAGMLINTESRNVQARIHALAHSIPQFPRDNGIQSMRHSAKLCGCSGQWIKKSRDEWCSSLGLQVPDTGTKSESAKRKYRVNAIINHWRKQKLKPTEIN